MIDSDVKVSVYMLAFNCKDFICKAIEGVIAQKTNFKFKLIIHDDASTDGAQEIIKSYAEKYPQIIDVVLQKENQYSKKIDLHKNYIEPRLEGDYIAVCEGDDYWIDEYKLQRQFDYMESHPECSMCTHNTYMNDLLTNKKTTFNDWNGIHKLSEEEIFLDWKVHTSSYFWRKSLINWQGEKYWFGDYIRLTWYYTQGEIVNLPYIMSVYNFNNSNGVMAANLQLNVSKQRDKELLRISYLDEFNEITDYKYENIVKTAIAHIKYMGKAIECENIISGNASCREKIDAAKKMISDDYYLDTLKYKSGLGYLKARFRYEGYKIYPIWILMRKIFL